jgi:uncharacterized RDD family membrane protein YckC
MRDGLMATEPMVVDRAAEPYLAIPASVTMETIGPAIPQAYGKLTAWMSAHGVESAGAPFVRYNLIDMERELQIEVGVPVRPGTEAAHAGPPTEADGPSIPPPTSPSVWSPPERPPRRGPAPGIEYAGFWIRTGAYLIDTIPLFIIGLVLFIPMMAAAFQVLRDVPIPPPGTLINSPEYQAYQSELAQRMTEAMGGMYPIFGVFQLISIAYFVGLWTWRQQTLGMMVLGLRVVRDADGRPPGLARSLLRYVGYWLSWVALFIGFIWVAFDSRKQGWHDKIAGTVVVRRTG